MTPMYSQKDHVRCYGYRLEVGFSFAALVLVIRGKERQRGG